MAGVGQKTSGFQDYEIKKTQVFPVVADNFSGMGDSKKKEDNHGDSRFFAGHQRTGVHTG